MFVIMLCMLTLDQTKGSLIPNRILKVKIHCHRV